MSRHRIKNEKDVEPGNKYPGPIEDLKQLDESTILVRKGPWLICYKSERTRGTSSPNNWIPCGQLKLYPDTSTGLRLDTQVYPWTVTRLFFNKTPLVFIRHFEGLRCYKVENGNFILLAEDMAFGVDTSGIKVLLGELYSPQENALGMMVREFNGKAVFYGVVEANFEADSDEEEGTDTVESFASALDIETDPKDGWLEAGSHVYITKLDGDQQQDSILLRTSSAIKVHKFDHKMQLQKTLDFQIKKSGSPAEEERLYFGNITGGVWQDVIQLDDSGLTLYQYQRASNTYKSIAVHEDYSKPRGWTSEHWDTVRILDIDGDGLCEIVSNGPSGLSALKYQSPVFVNILSDAGASERSTVVGVAKTTLFLQGSRNTLKQAELEMFHEPKATTTPRSIRTPAPKPVETTTPKLPSAVLPTTALKKAITTDRRWLDQWNPSQLFKNAVDPASGQMGFSLPIVNLLDSATWGLQFFASYSSQSQHSDFLGQGWTIPLAQDFIFLDKQQSVFPADFKWYLLSSGSPNELKLNKIEGDLQYFSFVDDQDAGDQGEITIVYNAAKKNWVVEGKLEKSVYGAADVDGAADAFQWSLDWLNWRMRATDVSKSRPEINSWYLNRRYDKARKIDLFYFYNSIKASLPGSRSEYTSEILLTSIEEPRGIKVSFNYGKKTSAEFQEPKFTDKEGNFLLPTTLTNRHFLTACTIKTKHFNQSFNFSYFIAAETRLLSSIKQQLSSSRQQEEPILELEYKKLLGNHNVVTLLKSGGLNFKYDFEQKTSMSPLTYHNNEIKYLTRDVPRLAIGPDYTVLAYKHFDRDAEKNAVALVILNRQMTRRVTTLYAPSLTAKFIDFILQAYKNKIVVIAATKDQKLLLTFLKTKQNWSETPSRLVLSSPDSQIQLSEDTIAVKVTKASNLIIFSWVKKTRTWTSSSVNFSSPITSFVPSGHFFIVSDGSNMHLVYPTEGTSWTTRILQADPYKISLNTIKRFSLEPEIKDQIEKAVEQYSVFVMGNMIATTSFEEKNERFQLTHKMYLLNSEFQTAHLQTLETLRDHFSDLTGTVEDQGTTFKYGYVKDGDVILVKILEFSGKAMEKFKEIMNIRQREKNIKQYIKDLNNSGDFIQALRTRFLLDWEKYSAYWSYEGLRCGRDDILYSYTGGSWVSTTKPVNNLISLGTKHVLQVSNHADEAGFRTANIYEQNPEGDRIPFQTPIKFSGEAINRYPAYLAFQKTRETIDLLIFDSEGKLDKTRLIHDEIVLGSSDHQNLITYRNNTSTDQLFGAYECVVRPTSTLYPNPQLFVSKQTTSDGTIERKTAYRRSFEVNRETQTYTETATQIPGADEIFSGRHEASRVFHIPSGNITTFEKWFDASGESVLPPIQKKEKAEEKPSKEEIDDYRTKFQLMDSSASLIVALTTPFDLGDDAVSYYGFESYEVNRIGDIKSKNKWQMTNAEILRGSLALTGESFLRLESTRNTAASVQGLFVPKQPNNSFLFSAWIRRADGASIVGETEKAVRVQLRTSEGVQIVKLYGSVKRRLGDWVYVELPLYLEAVLKIYEKFVEYKSKTEPNVEFKKTLEFVAAVEAPAGTSIDVDHIKFTPFPLDMDVNVYDENRKLTAVIKPDGRIQRTVYNRNFREIASIDEFGQVESLKTTSNSGSSAETQGFLVHHQHSSSVVFEPETGHLETWTRSAFEFNWFLDAVEDWSTSSSQLRHVTDSLSTLRASTRLFDQKSAAFRFFFHLEDHNSFASLVWNNRHTLEITRQQHSVKLTTPGGSNIQKLPNSGEIIAFVDTNFLWLWFDGVLLIDSENIRSTSENLWSEFHIDVKGQVVFEDMFVLNKPQITIEYTNRFGDKLQTVRFQDPQFVLVKQTLFDELGRGAITTKTTRVKRETGKLLLAFHQDFVTNSIPNSASSVWETGKLTGLVSDLNKNDNGAPFLRTCYAPNPLNQEAEIGLPGQKYTTGSKFSTKINFDSDVTAIQIIFPPNHGFQHTTELTPSGTKKISVFNVRGLQVASYSKTPGYDHFLSTNEYDDQDRLVKTLPPLYHQFVNTTQTSNPKLYQIGEAHLTSDERKWQNLLGTWYTYDQFDRLTKKVTPDTGVTEFLYDKAGQQRLMLISATPGAKPEDVVFFDYDHQNQLVATGTLYYPLPSDQLKNASLGRTHWAQAPNHVFQSFDYSDDDADPSKRGRVKHCVTKDGYTVVADTFVFNSNEQMIKRGTTSDAFTDELEKLSTFKREYKRDLLKSIKYPTTVDGEQLQIHYSYNRLGQLTGLGSEQEPTKYMAFAYLPTGELAEERFWPGTSGLDFTREFSYNSPGFLEKISDPFMTQEIAYEHGGYAQEGYGGGLAMQTKFNASWTSNADERWFRVQQEEIGGKFAQRCHQALKVQGYLNGSGEPVKEYYINSLDDMPLVCPSHTISTLMAQKQRPTIYGHKYAYGSHQELIKAKYFTEATEHLVQPLRPTSFVYDVELRVSQAQSELIWNKLKASKQLSSDQRFHDPNTAVGGQGLPLVDRLKLLKDLKSLDINYSPFFSVIEKYLLNSVAGRQPYNATDFEEKFLRWDNVLPLSPFPIKNVARRRAKKLAVMLESKDYFPTQASGFVNSLVPALTKGLESYTSKIPEIVKVLNTKFNHALGESPFDFKSSKIDANGNHRLFYSGFDHYKLEYFKGRNQVNKLKRGTAYPFERFAEIAEISKIIDTVFKRSEYSISHDTRGNIVKALHKGISKIVYHPVSQRPMDILKTDGTRLVFMYDTAGERISKRVFAPNGSLTLAKFYLRDETGQVVVDHEVHYRQGSSPIVLTSAYIYGPRGLLGFWRNNKFYSVFTDHVGSIRLVIHKGRVVASYDYLPYGDLMRSFGPSDPEVHTSYRFTGQEWDCETGLYNFHARLYDPSIGRFFQPDPKSQYFSPYVYGGNSPLAGVDPDGEFFFVFSIIVGVIAGMYLGGLAANKGEFNPFKWDWKNPKTFFGIIGGALIGALLPVAFVASVEAFSALGVAVLGLSEATALGAAIAATSVLGIGGAYLSAAAKFGWNPADWKEAAKNGSLFFELFAGFATGSGFAGGIGAIHNYASEIAKKWVRITFITMSYVSAGAFAYLNGVAANNGEWNLAHWEWKHPATWNGLLNGFDAGTGWPQTFYQMGKGAHKFIKSTKQVWKSTDLTIMGKILQTIKNARHGLAKTAGAVAMAYFMGAYVNHQDLNPSKWKWNEWKTYEGILNGVFYGKDYSNLLSYARSAGAKRNKFAGNIEKFQAAKITATKSFGSRFKTLLVNLINTQTKSKTTSLINGVFTLNALALRHLTQNLPEPARKEMDSFISKGKPSFGQQINPPPEVLKKHFTTLLNEAERTKLGVGGYADVGQLETSRSAIIIDKGSQFLACRKSRFEDSCLVNQGFTESPLILELDFSESVEWNRDFTTNPSGFMSRKVIPSGSSGPVSGIEEFVIARSKDGFVILRGKDAPVGIWSQSGGTFRAWQVPIEGTLIVPKPRPHSNDPRVIITDEMGGNTLYYRTDADGNLHAYHHDRRSYLEGTWVPGEFTGYPGDQQMTQMPNGDFVVFNNNHRFQLVNWQTDPQVQNALMLQLFNGFNGSDYQRFESLLPPVTIRSYQDSSGRLPSNPVFGFEAYSKSVSMEIYDPKGHDASSNSSHIKSNIVTYWDNGWKSVIQSHERILRMQYPRLMTSNGSYQQVEMKYLSRPDTTIHVDFKPSSVSKLEIPNQPKSSGVSTSPAVDEISDFFTAKKSSSSRQRQRRRREASFAPPPSIENQHTKNSTWFNPFVSWMPNWSLPGSEDGNSNSNYSSARPSPSITQMGDAMFNSTDWHGNMTWASVLIYKFTGHKATAPAPASNDSRAFTLTAIRASDIVQEFFELVTHVAEKAGLEQDVATCLDYFRLVNQVKQMLHNGQAEKIAQHLVQMLSQSMDTSFRHRYMMHFSSYEFLESVKQVVLSNDL